MKALATLLIAALGCSGPDGDSSSTAYSTRDMTEINVTCLIEIDTDRPPKLLVTLLKAVETSEDRLEIISRWSESCAFRKMSK